MNDIYNNMMNRGRVFSIEPSVETVSVVTSGPCSRVPRKGLSERVILILLDRHIDATAEIRELVNSIQSEGFQEVVAAVPNPTPYTASSV
jgi:hypothetical protein